MHCKQLLFFVFLGILNYAIGQTSSVSYRDKEDFDNFRKNRKNFAGTQILNLRQEGALIVLLQTSKAKINALAKIGKPKLAAQVEVEQLIENKLIMQAFLKEFHFCPVYFCYSNLNDSLLKGSKTAIFLDTGMLTNPSIELKEQYYLVAQKDVIYNTTIGFPESDEAAAQQIETGTPIKQVALVIKNKYLHQLKRPFPYYVEGYQSTNYERYVAKLNYNFLEFYGREQVRNIYIEIKDAKRILKLEKKAAKQVKKNAISTAKQNAKGKPKSKQLKQAKDTAITILIQQLEASDKKYEELKMACKTKLEKVKIANKARLKLGR